MTPNARTTTVVTRQRIMNNASITSRRFVPPSPEANRLDVDETRRASRVARGTLERSVRKRQVRRADSLVTFLLRVRITSTPDLSCYRLGRRQPERRLRGSHRMIEPARCRIRRREIQVATDVARLQAYHDFELADGGVELLLRQPHVAEIVVRTRVLRIQLYRCFVLARRIVEAAADRQRRA